MRELTNPANLTHILYRFIRADKNRHFDEDVWRLLDAVRGLQIFGGIGSGKSTGSGREIALSFLRNGYSGIVLTGKIDEKDAWVDYARETGRLNDIVIFEPGGKYKFNFLEYELNRDGTSGGGHTDNIVSLFLSIVKMGNRLDGSGDTVGKEPFWILAMERCLKAAVDLLKLAKKGRQLADKNAASEFDITITNIAKILRDAPTGTGHYNKFDKLSPPRGFEQHKALQEWANQSFAIYCLSWASFYINSQYESLKIQQEEAGSKKYINEGIFRDGLAGTQQSVADFQSDQRTFEVVSAYFLNELSVLADKTRSSILEHFFAFAAPFRSGMLADYFATHTSYEVLPERTFEGKIIILNFPVKQFLQLGIYAQCIYKKLWQQAVERRPVNAATQPVFMWIDESQYFINPEDMLFQTTARSSKACTVLITQNISNYYATMGGANSKAFVDSLLGNLGTIIYHNNTDAVMNQWASEAISKDYRGNLTSGDSGISISDEYQYQFLPKNYTLLRTGGNLNEGIIEAVVTVAGKKFSTGKNFLKIIFQQKLK